MFFFLLNFEMTFENWKQILYVTLLILFLCLLSSLKTHSGCACLHRKSWRKMCSKCCYRKVMLLRIHLTVFGVNCVFVLVHALRVKMLILKSAAYHTIIGYHGLKGTHKEYIHNLLKDWEKGCISHYIHNSNTSCRKMDFQKNIFHFLIWLWLE